MHGNIVHDPAAHRFWTADTGQELCGANRMLRLCGLVDDTFYTEESSVRGKHVHAATVMIDWGQEFDIDPRLVGYCDAYRRFLDVERPTYADNGERITGNPRLLLAGIIDRRVTRLRRIARKRILEFKTCEQYRPTPWHRWQLSLYMLCEPDYTGTDCCYLMPDGSYRLDSFDRTWAADRDTALHCAALIKARYENGDRSLFADHGDVGRIYGNSGNYDDPARASGVAGTTDGGGAGCDPRGAAGESDSRTTADP